MSKGSNINASLIHEARMILQHLFANKSMLEMVGKRSRREKNLSPEGLLCVSCIVRGVVANKAVVLKNGTSLCEVHVSYPN